MTRAAPLSFLLAAALAVGGCAVGPDYERPDLDTPVPEAWAGAGPTLAERTRDERERKLRQAAGEPQVRRLLDCFPGAEIVEVRDNPLAGEDDSE